MHATGDDISVYRYLNESLVEIPEFSSCFEYRNTMPLHTAYGLPLEELDIVAIDDSKAMQGIYRSIFSSFRTKRARVYGDPERAMNAMLLEPPNVLLLDWRMESTSGAKLLRTLRLKQMDPLCFLPVIVISAYGTQTVVELAYRLGANNFLLKPISPESLIKRLQWIASDSRDILLENDRYVIEGVDGQLAEHRHKAESLSRARAYHDEKLRAARRVHANTERVLNMTEDKPELVAEQQTTPDVKAVEKPKEKRQIVPVTSKPKPRRANGFAKVKAS